MKKIVSITMLFLIMFSFIMPVVNAADIETNITNEETEASSEQITSEEIETEEEITNEETTANEVMSIMPADVTSLSSRFTSSEAVSDGKVLNDYQISASESVTIESTYGLEMSTADKSVVYTLPKGINYIGISEADNIKSVTDTTDSNGITTVTVTYDKDTSIISQTSSLEIKADPDEIYSNMQLDINVSLDYPGGEVTGSQDLQINIYDYAANGSFTSFVSVQGTSLVDHEITYKIRTQLHGSYASLTLRNSGFRTSLKNVELNLNEVLVSLDGTSPMQSVADLGILSSIEVPSSTNYSYDSTSGIITFNDFYGALPYDTYDLSLIFKSSSFNDNSKYNLNFEDSFTYDAYENKSESIISHSGSTENLSFSETINGGNAFLTKTSYDNSTAIGEDDVELFEFGYLNGVNDLENLEFKFTTTGDIEVDKIRTPSNRYADYSTPITISYGGNTQVLSSKDTIYTLDTPIQSGEEVTITIASVDAAKSISSSYYNYGGLTFIGTANGNDGDTYSTTIDPTFTADIVTDSGTLTNQTLDNARTSFTYEYNLSYLSTPSITIINPEFRQNGTKISSAEIGDTVSIYGKFYKGDYQYGTSTNILPDPVIYVSIPSQLIFEEDINNIKFYDDGNDITDKITSFELLDDTSLSVFTNSENEGSILKIEMDGYDAEGIITYTIDTKVNESLKESITIDSSNRMIRIATTSENVIEIENHSSTGYASINELNDEAAILGGTSYVYNVTNPGLTITVPKAKDAKSFIDVDSNDGSDKYLGYVESSDPQNYPEYTLGSEGTYQVQIYNTTPQDDTTAFDAYMVLPDLSAIGGIVTDDLTIVDNDGSSPVNVYYTTDIVTDTTGWDTGSYGGINWQTGSMKGKEVTAVRFEFDELESDTVYTVNIPFVTEYLKTEDSVSYNDGYKGEFITSISNDGLSPALKLIKSDAPTITLNTITDADVYTYEDANSDLITDIEDYLVEDDKTSELVTYDTTDGFSDGNADDMYEISVEYNDGSTTTTYTLDEFKNLDKILAGDYTLNYVTEQDADAQTATKEVTVTVTPEDATITSDETDVTYYYYDTDKPTEAELVDAFGVEALEYEGTDLPLSVSDITYSGTAYDGELGTYTLTFCTEGITGNEVCTGDLTINIIADDATITSDETSLEYYYNDTNKPTEAELVDAFGVEALEYEGTTLPLSVSDITYSGTAYDGELGTYTLTFCTEGITGNEVCTGDLTISIIPEDAVISATDNNSIFISDEPQNDQELLDILSASAIDGYDGSNLTVNIDSKGGYTYGTATAENSFVITLSSVGFSGNTVTKDVNITFVEDVKGYTGNDQSIDYNDVSSMLSDWASVLDYMNVVAHNNDLTDATVTASSTTFVPGTPIYGTHTIDFEVTFDGDSTPTTFSYVLDITAGDAVITVTSDSELVYNFEDTPSTIGEMKEDLVQSVVDYDNNDIDYTVNDLDGMYDANGDFNGQYGTYTFTVETTGLNGVTVTSDVITVTVNEMDTDGDGIPDGNDLCPEENFETDVDGDGCEDSTDSTGSNTGENGTTDSEDGDSSTGGSVIQSTGLEFYTISIVLLIALIFTIVVGKKIKH